MSTSNNILFAESMLTSIGERAKFLSNCYLFKVLSNLNSWVTKLIKNSLITVRIALHQTVLLIKALSHY